MPWETIPSDSRTNVLETLPPYPIVLVTTRTNIITVNQINYFSFRPLRIGIGIAHVRYSYELLKAEREFVVNIPDAALVDAVKFCGSHSGRDGNKFQAAGLEREPAEQIGAACLPACRAQIECRVEQEIPFEERTWFVGRVVAARKQPGHTGVEALMCGRHHYMVTGHIVAPR